MIPRLVYFGCGTGSSPVGKMAARDLASREIGPVGDLNVSDLSSVLAPGIEIIDRARFESLVQLGQTVEAVNGITEGTHPYQVLTAAIAWVVPVNRPDLPGYIAELYGTPGIGAAHARELVEQDAMQIFAQKLGAHISRFPQVPLRYNARDAWSPSVSEYEIDGVDINVNSLVATTKVNRDGDWTCAFVFAGMLSEES